MVPSYILRHLSEVWNNTIVEKTSLQDKIDLTILQLRAITKVIEDKNKDVDREEEYTIASMIAELENSETAAQLLLECQSEVDAMLLIPTPSHLFKFLSLLQNIGVEKISRVSGVKYEYPYNRIKVELLCTFADGSELLTTFQDKFVNNYNYQLSTYLPTSNVKLLDILSLGEELPNNRPIEPVEPEEPDDPTTDPEEPVNPDDPNEGDNEGNDTPDTPVDPVDPDNNDPQEPEDPETGDGTGTDDNTGDGDVSGNTPTNPNPDDGNNSDDTGNNDPVGGDDITPTEPDDNTSSSDEHPDEP